MNDWLEYLTYGQLIEIKGIIKAGDTDEVISMKFLSVVYDIEIKEIEKMTVSEVNRLLEISIEEVEKEKKNFKKKEKKFNRFEIMDI